MKAVLEFCLSTTCAMPPGHRARICGDLFSFALHFQLLPITEGLTSLPCFLVHYRLNEGPKDSWDGFDRTATQLLQEKPLKGASKLDILDVARVLCSETWELAGDALRVRTNHFPV